MTIISLPTYQKHWIHTKPYGHDIVIWCDTGKMTIQCKWQDVERTKDGRVKQKEIKNECTQNQIQ
jgi:hypothetical protein